MHREINSCEKSVPSSCCPHPRNTKGKTPSLAGMCARGVSNLGVRRGLGSGSSASTGRWLTLRCQAIALRGSRRCCHDFLICSRPPPAYGGRVGVPPSCLVPECRGISQTDPDVAEDSFREFPLPLPPHCRKPFSLKSSVINSPCGDIWFGVAASGYGLFGSALSQTGSRIAD